MKVVSAAEMREIDRRAQAEYHIAGDLLMERAALAVRQAMVERYGDLRGRLIHIYCGKGNNGGDGLALARLLPELAAAAVAILAFPSEQYSGQAALNLERSRKFGIPVLTWPELPTTPDLVVDALLGTGAVGPPGGVIAEIVSFINGLQRPTVAVDGPTGVELDSGRVPGAAVRADLTVALGLPKPGLLQFPGAEFAGTVSTAAIGFPPALLAEENLRTDWVTAAAIKQWLPRHPPAAHKGSRGHTAVVGGSEGMTGAVALAALGAYRAGAGLVTAALRSELSFPEKPPEVLLTSWADLPQKMNGLQSMVIGPGLSTAPDGRDLLERLLATATVPIVLDADALNIVAQEPGLLNQRTVPLILTPHPGEMARLAGVSITAIQDDRLTYARHYAEKWGVVMVLKGARTVTALPDGHCHINSTGNPGMGTAGMGDVLAGVIGGLLAQGLPAGQAGVVGVYLHGLAGDLAALSLGPSGLLAGDLLRQVPLGIKKVLEI